MRNETSFYIDDAKISNLFMLFAQLLAAMQISFRSKTHFEKFSFEILKFIFFVLLAVMLVVMLCYRVGNK